MAVANEKTARMISSLGGREILAQRVPWPVAIRSASADFRASASAWRTTARTEGARRGGFGRIGADRGQDLVEDGVGRLQVKLRLLGRSSVSATGIACLLQLVDQVQRLARESSSGRTVSSMASRGLTSGFRAGRRGKKRQIV